jgi:hypothetical protein
MKYVVIQEQIGDDVREFPIIFPNILVHSVVAASVIAGLQAFHNKDGKYMPVAAGEISSMDLCAGSCHGSSETLKLKSRGEEDDKLITLHDYLHGVK